MKGQAFKPSGGVGNIDISLTPYEIMKGISSAEGLSGKVAVRDGEGMALGSTEFRIGVDPTLSGYSSAFQVFPLGAPLDEAKGSPLRVSPAFLANLQRTGRVAFDCQYENSRMPVELHRKGSYE